MGLLGGISLLLMQRLPQDFVTQHWFGADVGLAGVQLVWLVLGVAITATVGIVVRSDSWLRRYKYTWAAAGVGLLLLTFVFGTEVNGQRLTLQLGPFSGQPSEFLKVILVVFLAGYLSENRSLLMEQDTRVGPLRLPPLPYLAPMVVMWAIALGIVVIQRDLGRGVAVLRRVPGHGLRRDVPDQPRRHRPRPVPARQPADGEPVRPRQPAHRRSGWIRSPIRSGPATRWSRGCTRSRAAGCSGWASGPACR